MGVRAIVTERDGRVLSGACCVCARQRAESCSNDDIISQCIGPVLLEHNAWCQVDLCSEAALKIKILLLRAQLCPAFIWNIV